MSYYQYLSSHFRVSSIGGGGGGGDWGITPNIQKISLSPHVPPLFCPKNVDFVIFMQFLVILFKMSPH